MVTGGRSVNVIKGEKPPLERGRRGKLTLSKKNKEIPPSTYLNK